MKIYVHHDIVRQNIELFKKLVGKYSHRHDAKALFQDRIYTGFVNRLTGQIHFPELDLDEPPLSKGAFLNTKVWKAIEIRVKKHPMEQGVFEVAEEEANWRYFRCDDLEPLAYKVLAETVKTLNFVSKKFQPRLEMSQVAFELTSLEIGIVSGKDIVHEAWHLVDRIGAELLLKDKNEGTFLFRKDSFASVLEEQLRKNFNIPIKCVTLTFVEENGKITDKTLVSKDGRWLIYDDDPNLEGHSFSTVFHLLDDFKDTLKMPLVA